MHNQHVLFLEEEATIAKRSLILAPPKGDAPRDVFGEVMLDGRSNHHHVEIPKQHVILPPPRHKPSHDVFASVMLEDAFQSGYESTIPKYHIVLGPPDVEPLHDVFAEAMLEDTSTRQQRSPLDWVVSIGAHIAILTVLLILPLYFTSGLDIQKFNLTFLATPQMPAGALPPAPLTSSAAPRPIKTPTRAFVQGKLTEPAFIPKVVAASLSEPPALEEVPSGVPGGVPGGIPGGVMGGVLNGVTKVPAPVIPAAVGPKAPVQVGGRVKPPRLLYGPDPVYPSLARMSRITGTVVIQAIISQTGDVIGMQAISGHPLLIPAALTAVSKRKYEPTILDGDPTAIDLRVEVKFSMNEVKF